MAELLTDEIIIEHLNDNYGYMEEPDGPFILQLIEEEYGGKLDNTSDWVDNRYTLKIYSESTADSYDIFWCTHDERPYIGQDGYYYEDFTEWSTKAVEELSSGCDVWVDPNIWSDMEYDFNYELENWYSDFFIDKMDEARGELLDSGDYYEEKED